MLIEPGLSHNDYANPVAARELPSQKPVIGNSGSAFCYLTFPCNEASTELLQNMLVMLLFRLNHSAINGVPYLLRIDAAQILFVLRFSLRGLEMVLQSCPREPESIRTILNINPIALKPRINALDSAFDEHGSRLVVFEGELNLTTGDASLSRSNGCRRINRK